MRTIDLAKIDAQIRRLEELRRFMADPATASVIEQLISQQGYTDENSHAPVLVKVDTPLVPGNLRGDLLRNVSKICRSLAGTEFTAKEIIERLEKQGFVFKAQDKLIAVNGALRRLIKNRVITVASTGKGKRPSLYKIPERFPRLAEEGSQ